MHAMLFWMFTQGVPWKKQNVLLQTAEDDGEGGGAAGRGGGLVHNVRKWVDLKPRRTWMMFPEQWRGPAAVHS